MALTALSVAEMGKTASTSVRLDAVASVKPWGSSDLDRWGRGLPGHDGVALIGEIHHHLRDAPDPELFVETLFTGERLSVQVHPDADTLRTAALDGSIVDLLIWHLCVADDVFFTPAEGLPVWAAVISGEVRLDAVVAGPGEVWQLATPTAIAGDAQLLLAYTGCDPAVGLWRPA